MDLDDSFTERLLQRNKERRQFKTLKESETPNALIKKRHALVEEQQIRNELKYESSDASPKRSCDDSETDESPKRQCLERCAGSPSRQWPPKQSEKENNPVQNRSDEAYVPFKSSLTEKGLAALRKKDNPGLNVVNSGETSQPEVSSSRTYMFSTNSSEICSGRKARLAHLAADVNQWEDNLHKPSTTNYVAAPSKSRDVPDCSQASSNGNLKSSVFQSNSFKPNNKPLVDTNDESSRKPGVLSPSKLKNFESNSNAGKSSFKLNAWDQAIKATLETETPVKSPLKSSKVLNDNREYVKEKDSVDEEPANNSIKSQLKLFKEKHQKEDLNRSFDPTDLPLSARRALFEQASSAGVEKFKDTSFEPKLSVAQRAAMFENASQKSLGPKPVLCNKNKFISTSPNVSPQKPSKMVNFDLKNSPLKTLTTPEKVSKMENVKVFVSPNVKASPIRKINTDTQAVEQMLLVRVSSKVDVKEANNGPLEEVKGKAELVNYWEKLSASSKSGNSNSEEEATENNEVPESQMYHSEDEQEGYESETESKYERETESEFNYNTEATEEEYSESEHESDSAFEQEQSVFKTPKGFPIGSIHATKAYASDAANKDRNSWQADNYEDDTCDATSLSDGSSYAESNISTDIRSSSRHPSCVSSCSSFLPSSDPESPRDSEDNFAKTSCGSNSDVYGSNSDVYGSNSAVHGSNSDARGSNSDTPLLYTVSFYRKQKQETRTPPMKTIVRREQVTTPSSNTQKEEFKEQIKMYQEEILKQQTIIGQTSQALNLCHSTAEFSGSAEQVEAERLLLIATQKRQALLNEIQRLKTIGAEGEGVPDGMGTLTISDLQLPLKQEFLALQLEGKINDAVHWFLCLIRHGAQVIVTQMVSTDDKISNGALCFTNHIKLQNLPPDFSIVFEVYALQTKKESLPHEKKYHIKRDKSTLRLSSRGKKSEGSLMLPAISSPGGPNAVRSPSFGVIGFTRFTIQNCNKKCFTLDKVPFTSPLEGVLRVKLHLHAEHKVMEKGFLTMFEDVSGFGAWHRRWCALNSQHLTYWKYPDDEYKKAPIGSIDLKQCITGYVKPVSRDICARPHTFQLLTVRPQEEGDKNTLVSSCANTITTTKHMLSADTKDERVHWCDKLNEALNNVRKWDPHALRPKETHL